MTRLLTIPFALGQDEGTTSRELPAGPLREAVNVRQRRANALGVRPDYPAVSMSQSFGGTPLTPFTVFSMSGRLFAIGDRFGLGRPGDVFEYINQPGAAWTSSYLAGPKVGILPTATNLRNVGQPRDANVPLLYARVGAVNGIVALAYSPSGTAGGLTGYIHIFSAATDSTITFRSVAASRLRVVVAGTVLWVIGVDSSNDLVGFKFDTAGSLSIGGPVNLYTGTVTNNIFATCSIVTGSAYAQFAFAVRDGTTVQIRRADSTGGVFASNSFSGISPDVLAIAGSTVDDRLVVAYREPASDAFVRTYVNSTFVASLGPTAMFDEVVQGDLSVTYSSSGIAEILSEDASQFLRRVTFNTLSLATKTKTPMVGYLLNGQGVETASGLSLVPLMGNLDNQLVLLDGDPVSVNARRQIPLACIDQGIATEVGLGSQEDAMGQVCADKSTGKYYWSRIITGNEGFQVPIVAELDLDSLLPRQVCQIGNEALISGAMPLVHDGRQAVECGFQEIPKFIGAGSPTTGGSLIAGASYDYVLIWSWTDAQGRVIRSQPGDVATVTITAGNSAASWVCSVPHTLRQDTVNFDPLSQPTAQLFRCVVDQSTTTAILVGDRDFSTVPFVGGEFNGKTLQISVDGGGTQTVTFGTPANVADLIVAINAQTTGLTASLQGDSILLTDDTAGSTGSLGIVGGTTTASGLGYIGFFVAESATGTTTFVKSTVFNLAATLTIPWTQITGFGGFVTITDFIPDSALILQETLYTQGAHGALSGILPREGPPPFKFCCALRQRAFIGGLPDPTEVRISCELFPAEALAFSSTPPFAAFVEGAVTGVGSLDGIPIAFTQEAIYAFSPGTLPDDNGAGGQLGPPIRLPAEGGLSNAASILETSKGLFYQARDNKLMLLPLGGNNPPVWIGKKMQDTLAAFPNITGAVYVDVDNVACFTCQNVAGTASVIIVFDLLIGQWYLDTFSSAQVIKSAAPHAGLLAYIDGNTVRVQATSLVPAAFIPMNAKTGSILPFSNAGWGQLPSITVESVFRGNCKLRCRISYDDGVTFTNLKTFTYTTALGYVAGQTIVTQWWPGRRKGFSYTLDFDVLVDNGGTASEGLQLLHYSLELDGARPSRVRTSAAQRS